MRRHLAPDNPGRSKEIPMTKPFTRVATALVASMSVALFMSTQSQAQSPKSPYESPALVNAIMFHEIDAMTPTEQEAKSRYALSIIGFSVWFNSRCNFLPQNIETAIIAVYDQVRQDSAVAEANRSPEQRLRVDAVWSGLRDAKTFLGEQDLPWGKWLRAGGCKAGGRIAETHP